MIHLGDCCINIHSVLINTDVESDLFSHSDQVLMRMKEFESQGRVRLIVMPLDFCDSAPPAILCKSAPSIFSISTSSSDMLMLMNDGRVVSPLAMLRPVCAASAVNSLKKAQRSLPEWMRMQPGTSDYCDFHRHCTAHTIEFSNNNGKQHIVISRVPGASVVGHTLQAPASLLHMQTCVPSAFDAAETTTGATAATSASSEQSTDATVDVFASLNLSANDVAPVQQSAPIVVLDFASDATKQSSHEDPDENTECSCWAQFLKDLSKKMRKKNKTPLPLYARGMSLKGHVQYGGCTGRQPAHVSLSSEGFLYQQHLQLCSGSCVEAEGELCIRLTNTLVATAAPTWSRADCSIAFKHVEHRDICLRVMQRIIVSLSNREKKATSLLSSIEMQSQSKTEAEDGLSRALLNILSPTESAVFGALDYPYDGPLPPIMPQLMRTICILLHRYPDVMLEEVHVDDSGLMHSVFGRRIQSRPLHLLIRSCFHHFIHTRAAYWTIYAVANAVSSALHVKDCPNNNNEMSDDDGYADESKENTLLQTLLISKSKVSLFRDHDFVSQTLDMLLRVDPSLASEQVSDSLGETVFSRICNDLDESSCLFHRSAYSSLNSLLHACPSLASKRIPSMLNQFPLHMICGQDPQPRELRLLIDAYPQAAASSNYNGLLPIHMLAHNTHFPKCVDILIAAAPDCMTHHCRLGHYPLHYIYNVDQSGVLKGKARDRYLSSLLRGCHGCIVCDFAPSSCSFLLKRLVRWAAQTSVCEYYELICNMNVLDICFCANDDTFPAADMADLLSNLLPHCISLTILDISGNGFSRECIETLLPALLKLPKLQRLNLDGCEKTITKLNHKTTTQNQISNPDTLLIYLC
jgi:hypothetical protein